MRNESTAVSYTHLDVYKRQLPGGMMGSLMADLESNLESINKYKAKHNLPFMTQDQLLIKLFDEVAYVWPRVGYPPLVTPFSQYVKNLAMMNVMAMEKGKERWGMIADDIWDMILGKAGRLPGKLAPEIIEKAEREGRKFFDCLLYTSCYSFLVYIPFVATRCSPFVRLPPAKVLISITLLPHFSSLSPIP